MLGVCNHLQKIKTSMFIDSQYRKMYCVAFIGRVCNFQRRSKVCKGTFLVQFKALQNSKAARTALVRAHRQYNNKDVTQQRLQLLHTVALCLFEIPARWFCVPSCQSKDLWFSRIVALSPIASCHTSTRFSQTNQQ